jgi:hypothetical protein
MAEPEIARRCPDCGVSVRGSAFFCPQCGRMLRAGATSVSSTAEASELPSRRITDGGRKAPTMETHHGVLPAASDAASLQDSAQPDPSGESQESAEAIAPRRDDGRSKRQRMTAAARDVVEEKLSPRVEKLRHASNVMLEEAAYDPSLRFVLVAIAILIISLLLLLLNYLLG